MGVSSLVDDTDDGGVIRLGDSFVGYHNHSLRMGLLRAAFRCNRDNGAFAVAEILKDKSRSAGYSLDSAAATLPDSGIRIVIL